MGPEKVISYCNCFKIGGVFEQLHSSVCNIAQQVQHFQPRSPKVCLEGTQIFFQISTINLYP